MQHLPKVSVIVPVYNEENYILKTLEALRLQTYANKEIIIVNNNSTDNTEVIIKAFISKYKLTNFYLLYEGRKGTNYARECARLFATGEVVAQLDADCVPNRNWLEMGMNYLMKNNAIALTGPYFYFDTSWVNRNVMITIQKLTYPLSNHIVQFFNRGAIIIGGNSFIVASFLKKIGGYNTNLTFYGDDVELGKRLIEHGKVLYKNKLQMNTSYRRFKSMGFLKVNKKYQQFFWNLVFNRANVNDTIELVHPR